VHIIKRPERNKRATKVPNVDQLCGASP
jgi:hypothetical protein